VLAGNLATEEAPSAVAQSGVVQAVPILLINLDRSANRLARMRREFARGGVAFERFPAVDGTNLPDSLKHYFCDPSGTIASSLRPGELGCYASHLAVWQWIAAGRYGEAVLVCEDDWLVPDGFRLLLTALLGAAPPGWDLIRLSPRTKRAVVPVARIDPRRSLVRYSREPASAAAYLISRRGASKLLTPGLRFRPVDQDFRRPWAFMIDSYGIWPPLREQPDSHSVIDAMGGRARSRSRRLILNDTLPRPIHGIRTLGLWQWAKCEWWNAVARRLHPPAAEVTGAAYRDQSRPWPRSDRFAQN